MDNEVSKAVNVKEIQYIIAISEEQSLTQAAKKLFLSQSTLSHSLNRIEEELGTLLFDRSTLPLKLTAAGEAVVETGRRMLALNKELYQQIQDIAECRRGSLTVGMTHLAERYYLPLVLPSFRRQYPGIQINTAVASLAELEQLLLKNKVDFAVILPLDNPLLEFKPIFTMDIWLALPIDHPLCQQHGYQSGTLPEIDLQELAAEEFIMLQPGRKLLETAFSACRQAGFSPKVVLEVSNLDTAHALVAEGYGVTFMLDVIRSYAPKTHRVAYFRIKSMNLYQTFCLGFLKNKYLPKFVDSFLHVQKVL